MDSGAESRGADGASRGAGEALRAGIRPRQWRQDGGRRWRWCRPRLLQTAAATTFSPPLLQRRRAPANIRRRVRPPCAVRDRGSTRIEHRLMAPSAACPGMQASLALPARFGSGDGALFDKPTATPGMRQRRLPGARPKRLPPRQYVACPSKVGLERCVPRPAVQDTRQHPLPHAPEAGRASVGFARSARANGAAGRQTTSPLTTPSSPRWRYGESETVI